MWRRYRVIAVGLAGAAVSLLVLAVLRGTTRLEESLWGRAIEGAAVAWAAVAVGLAGARWAKRRSPDTGQTADGDARE